MQRQDIARGRVELTAELADKARLSYARFAGNDADLSRTRYSLLPHLGKQCAFAGSADHWGKRRPLSPVEPAFAGRKGFRTPGFDRLLHALERSSTKRGVTERSARQLVSARTDHDAILNGEPLQASSDMRGTAEYFPPIGGFAGHTADDDNPGVYPDAHTEADEAAIRQQKLMFLDRRRDRQRSAHRALGIIFMGLWHAEI